ncbi:GTD2A protein, partial [Amia calva]|nr:GTD2A protein [Amia calva]
MMLSKKRKMDSENSLHNLLHNNVRWLSKGTVLVCFWSIRREVASFLVELRCQKATQFSLFLEAFLVDITSHLNELNLRLQGKGNSICELMTAVRSFQRKLEVFKEDLQGDCAHFPALQEQVQGQRDVSSFVDFIDKLIVNFSNHFDSFSFGQQLTMFIQNPFLITDVRGFSKEVTQHFKLVNDLQADVALKEHFVRTDPSTFTMFGSTHNCEAAFSTMNIIKTKYRSRLTNEYLHMCMRMALTPFKPRSKSWQDKLELNSLTEQKSGGVEYEGKKVSL